VDLKLTALLVPVGVFTFLGLLTWAACLGRPRAAPATDTLVLRHSLWLRGFALFSGFGIPLGITVLVFVFPPKDTGDLGAILGVFCLFAFLSAPLLWESLRYALVVSPDGLACYSPWRGRAFVAWEEVVEVTYSQGNGWFVVHADDGYRFRVPVLVPGVTRFLAECERHLSLPALMKAAQGYRALRRPLPRQDDALEKWGDRHHRPRPGPPPLPRPDDERVQPPDPAD
jgi:hypothetical protein